jgi:hypothetical protein
MPMKPRPAITRAVLALLVYVAASGCGEPSQGTAGSAGSAPSGSGAGTGGSLMVLYAGDIQGVLDPCG